MPAGEINVGFQPELNDDIHLKQIDKAENRTPESNREKTVINDCGPPCFKTRFLNRFRNPKWVLAFLSWAAFTQGFCINGLVNVVITTLETRFSLQSTQTGLIASSYDIGSMIVIIPVTYLGGKLGANKPRWISAGLLIMGLGSLVFTLPHFTTAPYNTRQLNEDSIELCGKPTQHDCKAEGTELSPYRFVFIIAQVLHGVGAAPLITLGTTYLDENLDKASSPLYIAIFQTWFVVGPALGYVVGGQLLSVHTDLTSSSGLTPESGVWVGAWWPGFLMSFSMAVLCSIFLIFYPESLLNRTEEEARPERKISGLKVPGHELPKYLCQLLTNPTYICISVGLSMDALAISGLSAFLPKFLEQQYSLSGGVAAQLVGLMAVPGGGGGTFLGGWIIKRLKLTRTRIILMCAVSQLLTLIPIGISFFLHCDNLPYVGINHHAPQPAQNSYFPIPDSVNDDFLLECNSGCRCHKDAVDPVCGSDQLMYLSPCLAGCTAFSSNYNMTNCACVEDGGTVSRSKCKSECGNLIPYVIIQFLGIMLTFLASMPGVVATLRAVEHEQRSLALGVQSIINRLLGSIPGPVFLGFIVDRACLYWQSSCDEGSSSCLVYNNSQMAMTLLGTVFAVKTISVLFYTLGVFASKRSRLKEEENTLSKSHAAATASK